MAVEFVASVVPASQASVRSDPDYPVQAASLLDEAGFDKLLIGYSASAPDGLLVANEVLTTTSALGVVVTQVPGVAAPTVAARQHATLAAFHPGRVGLHAVGDLLGADASRDADSGSPDERAARAAEFLEVVRLAWRSRRAFDYAGEYYRIAGAHSAVRPASGDLQVYFSGESPADLRVGAAQADVFLLQAQSVSAMARRIAEIRSAAAQHGRSPRFGVSLRLLASPEQRPVRDRLRFVTEAGPAGPGPGPWSWSGSPGDPGRPAAAPVWVPPGIPLARGAGVTSRVRVAGGYDEVARGLLDYVEIGVSTLVIGHDPYLEAADCAEVITRVREAAASRRRAVI
jgi:alkanesulfonate monooxygenase